MEALQRVKLPGVEIVVSKVDWTICAGHPGIWNSEP
jgi:hypothetical protein